jgi:hypothetical protein
VLTNTLLGDPERQALAKAGAIAALPLAADALAGASAGLKAYAAIRSTRPRDIVTGAVPSATDDHREGFEGVCAAIAEVAGKLATDSARQLADAIPGLFRDAATGSAALRQYWVGLGFAPAVVDTYIAEAAKAPPEALAKVGRAIPDGKDWQDVVTVFGAGNPNPNEWGLGYCESADLHPSVRNFAMTCRAAGMTPSLYVITSVILLLQKLGTEVAPK